jgi:hypothetical protein
MECRGGKQCNKGSDPGVGYGAEHFRGGKESGGQRVSEVNGVSSQNMRGNDEA